MWTLTIDPTLFASPLQAYQYIREHRCISEFMRKLRQSGHLSSGRYFYVVEWQKKTEMVHFHLLVDSAFVPFDLVCDIWNSFRPRAAGPVQGDRPGFGSVRFSAGKIESSRKAANYACGYLIKFPEHGYPAWVLDDLAGEVHRYSTSRGFWGTSEDESEIEDPTGTDDEDLVADEDEAKPERSTIRQRVGKCGEKSLLVRVVESVDLSTGEMTKTRIGVLLIDAPLPDVAVKLQRDLEGKRRLPVTADDLPVLHAAFSCRSIVRADPPTGRHHHFNTSAAVPGAPRSGGSTAHLGWEESDPSQRRATWAMIEGR